MPSFNYEAVTASGQRSTGTLEAADRGEAVRKLARQGLQPFSVQKADGKAKPAAKTPTKDARAAAPGKKAKSANGKAAASAAPAGIIKLSRPGVIQFTEELCDLLNAGLQLEPALHAMEGRSTKVMRELAVALRERVRDGVPLSVAMHQVCPSFGELYCNLVAAGEASGSLGSILDRQARYLNQMEELRAKVSSALIYPIFIFVIGLVLGIVMMTYLLPKLALLVQSTGRELPLLVQYLLAISDFLKAWWWLIIVFLILTIITIKVLFQSRERLAWWHKVKLDLPAMGAVLRTSFEVQFLETLGNLLKNGLPLHRALELMRKATMNLFIRERMLTVEASVADGGSLSRALEKSGVARPLVLDMVRVGEQTGELADALEKAAGRFDRQLAKAIDRATALLQPVIMMGVAVVVGGMVWLMINVVFSTLAQMNQR